MGLSPKIKAKLVQQYGQSKVDTGCSEVQIALLSTRIKQLTEHLNAFKKDKHSRYGLTKIISQRRRLLNYLKKNSVARYKAVIEKLGLRN